MSDGKVVGLYGDAVPHTGEVSDVCVSMLEELLERARSGDLQGFACAYLDKDNLSCHLVGGRVGGFGMIGALEMAKSILVEVNHDG